MWDHRENTDSESEKEYNGSRGQLKRELQMEMENLSVTVSRWINVGPGESVA